MAANFLQAHKKQRYLILILTLVICAVLLMVWQGFFKGPVPSSLPSSSTITTSKIEINWDAFKNPKLEKLKAFVEIPTFEDKTGRKNPFAPY